ncbi:unnamed protein product [Spirodela intermedia]|uniref:Uncharacterized protein n=1 Tax=Spirodela intermedia TaxID=51605 RepID=A0ABN7E8N7_SPIIN|nr:unnamed protein product [Spirodela intermedia]
MGRRIISDGCHPAERKKTATLRLSGSYHLMERSWMEVGHVWGACQGASSSSLRSKRRLFITSSTLLGVCLLINRRCFTQWIHDPFIANRSTILVAMLCESC